MTRDEALSLDAADPLAGLRDGRGDGGVGRGDGGGLGDGGDGTGFDGGGEAAVARAAVATLTLASGFFTPLPDGSNWLRSWLVLGSWLGRTGQAGGQQHRLAFTSEASGFSG